MSSHIGPSQTLSINSLSISVVIPVYNGEKYIAHALESVMRQTLPAHEILVVDDGSTDGTATAVREFIQHGKAQNKNVNIELLQQENQGNGAAKNRGLAQAQGELIAFLDADDRWLPEKLAAQARDLVENPALGFVLCHMRAILETGTTWPPHFNREHYQNDPPLYAPSALLARRAVFDQIGNFDTSYLYGNDSDWFLRAHEAGIGMAIVPQVLVEKWIHGENVSHQTATMSQDLFRGLRASLQRRRQNRGHTTAQEQTNSAPAQPVSSPARTQSSAPVSTIIPVFNGERYIGAALESILAQTVVPQSVIVIDDGSTDNTRAVIARIAQQAQKQPGPQIDYHYQPNQGSAVALNRGIELAATEFLTFLDADDLWEPDKTAAQLAQMEQEPELEAVFGHMRQFYSPDVYNSDRQNPGQHGADPVGESDTAQGARQDIAPPQIASAPQVQYGQEIIAGYTTATLLIRRAAFHRIGLLDPALKACFVDWFARARHMHLRYRLLDAVVALRRVHDTNLTIQARGDVQSDYFRILKANLARNRASKSQNEKSQNES